jgi:hypothetical protein
MNSEKVIAEYKELDTGISIRIVGDKTIVEGRSCSIELPAALGWMVIRDNAVCSPWEVISYKPYICRNETTEVYIAEEYVNLVFVDP